MPVARNPFRIAAKATAMIDISDGLLIDLNRLCRESRVGAKIRAADIPMSDSMEKAAASLGISCLDLALNGGEDYELLFTAPPGTRVKAACIGEITGSGIAVVDNQGRSMHVSAQGYQHFAVQG
jgi:thiamine-monophosphate kinase